jgi:hypothetical protein
MFGLTTGALTVAIIIAIALMIGLWGPYLYEEIVRGKAKEGPRSPVGAGDTHAGTRSDPAPGHIETVIDPYDDRNRR